MTDQPPFRQAILHNNPLSGCGLTAFYAVRRPVGGQNLSPDHFQMPDGSTPNEDYTIRCGHCGHDATPDIMRWLYVDFPQMRKRENNGVLR